MRFFLQKWQALLAREHTMDSRYLLVALTVAVCALTGGGCDEDTNNLPLKPQIHPQVSAVNFCEVGLPPAGELAEMQVFDLMLYNLGRQELQITSIDVRHDRNCAFEAPYGDIRLHDNDENDDYAATARSRSAAFARIRYSPQAARLDEVTLTVHSNAENQPELDVNICAKGSDTSPLTCHIRTDPDCDDTQANAHSCTPGPELQLPHDERCPSNCSASGTPCWAPSLAQDVCPDNLPAGTVCQCPAGEGCVSPYYCVEDEDNSTRGSCYCRNCAVPPDEGWSDCSSGS
jgi:hypothetical protein